MTPRRSDCNLCEPFSATKWGDKHSFLPLVLPEAKTRLASRDKNLNCKRLAKPELLNPKIEDDTKGHRLLQLKEDQKVECQEYTFQEVVDSVAVESTVAAVETKYVKEMVTQLQTWYVITTKEKLVIKSHFLTPWSDTTESHIKTFVRQLDRRQLECKEHGVTVTNDDKADHFVA